jgi:hypothetical protein
VSAAAVTLDMSKAQPIAAAPAVTLDMSKAQPINQPSQWDAAQEAGHQNRLSALAGLTGMPTPNMSEQDGASFEQGKAAGAVSVPVVAGAVSTPAVIGAGVNALAPALTRGVVGMTAWAAEHPIAAKMIWEGLKTAMYGSAAGAGAKFVGKIIKASPEGE